MEYIRLAPGFVREVLEVYESWNGKESLPLKVQELMMVLQIEVDRRYKVETRPVQPPSEVVKKIETRQNNLLPFTVR